MVYFVFAIFFLLLMAEWAIRFTLYKRLKLRHPAKYEAMDRPSVFIGRFTSAWALLGFLVFRDQTLLKDRTTTRLADSLLVLRAAIFAVFAILWVTIWAAGGPHRPA